MIKNVLKKVFGDKSQKDQKEYQPYITATNEEFQKLAGISNDELRNKTTELKNRIADKIASDENEIQQLKAKAEDENTDVFEKEKIYDEIDNITKDIDKKIEEILKEILPEAFAVVKETAKRFKDNDEIVVTASDFDKELASNRNSILINGNKAHWKTTWDAAGSEISWDMLHYDVQIMGGVVLHSGKIAEMQTGEGKTLVSTLPVYLNALAGKGVHLVTVNDYLAKRDSEWMGPLYEFHGMSVDCIDKHQPNTESRRKAYEADVTYGTNNEFGFDYLRDNMGSDPDQLVQKKHHYAIIDEVDSVLIDDARTPLIISGPTPQGDKHEYVELKPKIDQLYNVQKKLVTQLLADAKRKLKAAEDESVDKKEQKTLLEEGGVALLRAHRGLPKNKALIKFLSEPGIKIHLQKTENVYMAEQNKRMPEIDKELFFVIDEKNNGIELMDKGIDLLADKNDSDQYTLPDIGSLIAELEKQDLPKEELLEKKDTMMRDFTIKSERIHTMNQLLKAYALFEKEVDYVVMDNKVKIVDEQTGRIMEGRRYSDGLHMAIEAKENVSVEAATQTYATVTLQNYFRMYHKLSGMTGTAETEAKEFWDIYDLEVVVIPTNKPVVRKDDNDMVYKTAREKYNAIIDETMGMVEAGRPVLVGTTTVEISELLSRMLKMKGVKHQVLNAKYHQREAEIVAEAGKSGTVTIATNMAGRGTDIKLGEGVKDAGGLAIIGTERHDSRRVDRQLRGRSGRQGDPGSSQFFVSLEDNLMRLFGSERIAKLMDRMGLKEGEVIQHSMITRSIERAQKKVEENNFGIRKRLLEYDDVMNAQRKAIYKKRKHALFGERLEMDIANMFYDTSEAIIAINHPYKDYENFELDILREFSINSPFTEDEFINGTPAELSEKLAHAAQQRYVEKMERLANKAYPIIKQVYENEAGKYKNMVFPVSDGSKSMQVIVNLEKAYNQKGAPLKIAIEKNITLGIIDNEWKEHLREMDDLRQSVQQAVYEQKDPLLIYKLESYELFKKMADRMNREVISFLTKADLPEQQTEVKSTNQEESSSRDNYANSQTTNTEVPEIAGREGYDQAMQNSQQQQQQKTQPIKRTEKKVGRNDPCPCGSGKKYKQCHGK